MFACYKDMQAHSEISETILSTAIHRGPEKSTCPSEIARMLFPDDWRKQMKNVLDVAIHLHNQGKVIITQKGMPVDVNHIKGPVRIKVAANTVERLSLIFIYVI